MYRVVYTCILDFGTDRISCETSNGACIFPFEYYGVIYNGCTTAGGYAPWCQTSVDETEEVWWGDCGEECKMHQGMKHIIQFVFFQSSSIHINSP